MKDKINSERVIIFIDGSNFYHGLKENIGISKINFQKFVELLVGQRDLLRTYYYNATLSTNEGERYKDQQRFFAYLRTIPNFTVRLGRLEKREGAPPEEKGVDVAIATDMLVWCF